MTANQRFPGQLFAAKPNVLDWLERRFRGDFGGQYIDSMLVRANGYGTRPST